MDNIVAITKCDEYTQEKVDKAVKKSLDLLGGIGDLVSQGDRVLLKPNLVIPRKPEKMATTHPMVIESVIKILKETGVEIWIGDSGVISTPKIFSTTGIKEIAEKYDCKICDFDRGEIKHIRNDKNYFLKEILISKYVTEADIIINIPKIKTHHAYVYTGAIKNLYGTIVGNSKKKIHGLTSTLSDFDLVLLDVLNNVTPQLNIMDGVVGMEGAGPTNGKSIKTGMIMASFNAVAMDIAAIEKINIKLKDVTYLKRASSIGLCTKPKIVGDEVSDVSYKYPPRILNFYNKLVEKFVPYIYTCFFKTVPIFNEDRCISCGVCRDICPMNAIKLNEGIPVVNKHKCISCFCCHEACMHNAIVRSDLKKSDSKKTKKGKC